MSTTKQPCIDCNGTGEKSVAGYRDNDLPKEEIKPAEAKPSRLELFKKWLVERMPHSWMYANRARHCEPSAFDIIRAINASLVPVYIVLFIVAGVGGLSYAVISDIKERRIGFTKRGYIIVQHIGTTQTNCWITNDKEKITGDVLSMNVKDTNHIETDALVLGIKDVSICHRIDQ
jgi:hypothetical protein